MHHASVVWLGRDASVARWVGGGATQASRGGVTQASRGRLVDQKANLLAYDANILTHQPAPNPFRG
ncbi:MAG: hypothetical protein ACPGWR_11215 [Ardenticatenaceae bacterium]